MIRLHHCTKTYHLQKIPALYDMSFDVEKGEFVYIIGPSGAGKTTLLKLLTCQEKPTSGQVVVASYNLSTIRDSSIPFLRRNIGMIFQDFKLVPYRTVYQNVSLALEVMEIHGRANKKKVISALASVGMQTKLEAFPPQLSGGEQQRVAIARAIVNEPAIILADEPTGNLDREMTDQIMEIIRNINLKGATILIATHDPSLIGSANARVMELTRGRLISDKKPFFYSGGYGSQ
ncbi:MAG: cell division ATP-binding protein FtsE [Syntrophales bacterium LBB04]|nr:cell division ATP-binding protein FtsE [Syntrophales bacterium LBB04]